MKFFTTFFLMFCLQTAFAQNQRFFYEYRFAPDSTAKDSIITEMMLLDVTKTGSDFYSHKKYVADSIMNAEIKQQLRSTPGSFNVTRKLDAGSVPYSVKKTYPDFKVELLQNISSDSYLIVEDQKPEWKILPEKEKIGEYEAQKAETRFGGRIWTAWFSTAIPIQDGPYKFYGLPGLIVKMEDKTGTHKMTLVGNKTFEPIVEEKNPEGNGVIIIGGNNGKSISVTEKQFKKLWKDYVNDPSKNMREVMMKSGSGQVVNIKMRDSSGKELTNHAEIYRSIEKRVKEMVKKNNNRIEPELYQ